MKRLIALWLLATSVVFHSAPGEAAKAVDTPLKKGSSHYYINPPTVILSLGHGAIPGDTTFLDKDGLASEFHQFLNDSFAEKAIHADDATLADGVVDIELNYTRKFNYGGKALNKPEFWYKVTITKAGEVLASYATPRSTTDYGYFKEVAIDTQIAAFKWGVEDEPKELALIAKTIAREVSRIGK